MDQEPVSYEYDNGEHAKLTDGPVRKERDDAEDGVVGDNLRRVGSTSTTKSHADSLLDR